MGTTANFLKLRADKNPKVGQWNKDYKTALALAKKEGRPIVVAWSNGDLCGSCISAEKCMMDTAFKNWMKTSGAYFVFQCSADKDKGQTAFNWVYNSKTTLKRFPGFRVTSYTSGKATKDLEQDGDTLRGGKTGTAGAKSMASKLKAMMGAIPVTPEPTPAPEPAKDEYYVRLNEAMTTAQINKVLAALDKNGGYCPCQAGKTADTKCHCKDFREEKGFNEPCICKIYIKVPKQ